MKTFLALFLSLAAASAETLRWDMEGNPADLGGYRIYCKIVGNDLPMATLDVGKQTQWDADNFLMGQPEGRKLEFVVKAYNTDGIEGEASNVVSVVVEHTHIKSK